MYRSPRLTDLLHKDISPYNWLEIISRVKRIKISRCLSIDLIKRAYVPKQ